MTTDQQQRTDGFDPFHAYVHLTSQLGEGNVFLLDAAQDTGSPEYRMSLIGALPLLEVAIKDGCMTVYADEVLGAFIQEVLLASGCPVETAPSGAAARSIVGDPHSGYFPSDPMAALDVIRQSLQTLRDPDQPPFTAGFLGYIGYDAVHYLEALPKTTADDRGLPDVRLQWHGVLFHCRDGQYEVFDAVSMMRRLLPTAACDAFAEKVARVKQEMAAYAAQRWVPCLPQAGGELPLWHEDVEASVFSDNVHCAKELIRAGDIFQVVLSKRLRVEKRIHPYTAYDRLRKLNPSPYMFMAEYPDMRIFGASPEVQFRAVQGMAQMKPIAGTSKGRGKTPEEDAALEQRLFHDEKERAEHVMLVDLCRNDLGRVCEVGSVRVDSLMQVEPYSHLFHLVSQVSGTLRSDVSVFHALLATFPAGTLSGAPKIRAMEIIDELETLRRGPYGGMIGMVDFSANANTSIIIRTVIEWDQSYYVQVGAGIVADSDPAQEWLECGHKAGAVLEVLGVPRAERQPVKSMA